MEYYARTGISKREPTLTRYGVGVFAYSQTLDISKARQELGYCPSISIDEGIQRYAHWLNNR
jgi:nucleoside-diphosphate-sugar epimerase